MLRDYFSVRYGTERGYIRYLLSLLEYHSGTINQFKRVEFTRVDRVVFVCLGNICRSAYAHHYALAKNSAVNIASLGLSTTTGVPANEVAMRTSLGRGIDMSVHQATDLSDFTVLPGDLYLVMEIRQARKLDAYFSDRDDIQLGLLGNYCPALRPHLHDPFSLSEPYFETCFKHIEGAVDDVAAKLARANPQLSAL